MGLWPRLLAWLVDAPVIVALIVAGALLAVPATAIFPVVTRNPTALRILEILVTYALAASYLVICWSRIGEGQTLGMRLLGLRVIAWKGGLLGGGRASARLGAFLLNFIPLMIVVVYCSSQTPQVTSLDELPSALARDRIPLLSQAAQYLSNSNIGRFASVVLALAFVLLPVGTFVDRQAWHDYLSGTFVVRSRNEKQ